MKKASIVSVFMLVSSVEAFAEDQAVLTVSTSISTTNQSLIFAQMSQEEQDRRNPANIGAFFIKDYLNVTSPVEIDATSTAADLIQDYRESGKNGAAKTLQSFLVDAVSNEIMRRNADKIIEENRHQ